MADNNVKGNEKAKPAETHAGREERPETGSEEETSKDYSTGSEGTVGDIQATEEERIALAIGGKGEFLSEELKKLLMEIEEVQGLEAGTLGEEIEARLRGVTEPSVEKLREALKEEIEKLEERFNVQKRKDGTSESPGNPTRTGTGVDPGGTPKPVEAPDGGVPGGRGGIYVPDKDNTLKVLPAPEARSLRSERTKRPSSSDTWTSYARNWNWPCRWATFGR